MTLQLFFRKTWDTAAPNIQFIKKETSSIIEKFNTYVTQPSLQTIKEHIPSFYLLVNTAIKTMKVFIFIAIFVNPLQNVLFVIGAATSILFPEPMKSLIDRISTKWNSLPLTHKILSFTPFFFALTRTNYFLIISPMLGAAVSLYFQNELTTLQDAT